MADEPQPMPGVQPQPVPTIWQFDHTVDGRFVVMVANTFEGQRVMFIGFDNVEPIVTEMMRHKELCARAQLGLQVVESGLVGPDGKPMGQPPVSPEVEAHLERLRSVATGDDVGGDVAESGRESEPERIEWCGTLIEVGDETLPCALAQDHAGPCQP